jgi:hypothetical protein
LIEDFSAPGKKRALERVLTSSFSGREVASLAHGNPWREVAPLAGIW